MKIYMIHTYEMLANLDTAHTHYVQGVCVCVCVNESVCIYDAYTRNVYMTRHMTRKGAVDDRSSRYIYIYAIYIHICI